MSPELYGFPCSRLFSFHIVCMGGQCINGRNEMLTRSTGRFTMTPRKRARTEYGVLACFGLEIVIAKRS